MRMDHRIGSPGTISQVADAASPEATKLASKPRHDDQIIPTSLDRRTSGTERLGAAVSGLRRFRDATRSQCGQAVHPEPTAQMTATLEQAVATSGCRREMPIASRLIFTVGAGVE